ncbi:MAG: helix-hairpin-helix domain-containing protein [Anaerolineae bacterium]|nr:helix-hairpin-helix domain-containing protein [Anaerolineae bacterium]MDW8298764.1 helix-hairpin-helix domain-containing protein [Anaerolineae bacterium]
MSERYRDVLLIVLIGCIALGAFILLTYQPPAVTIRLLPPLPSATPLPIRVHVSGAVRMPALYDLPRGSRVEDAIRAAGGLLPEADTATLNLAWLLSDGDQVYVWRQGEAGVLATRPANSTPVRQIRINTASEQELMQLPGVGPALAREIIAYRQQYGRFRTLSDLDNVKGVGPARLAQWAPLLIFD